MDESTIEGFRRAVDEYASRLLAVAELFVRDPQEAEDVVQTVFLKAWQNWEDLVPPERILPWLLRVARNECVTALRRRNGTRSGTGFSFEDVPERTVQDPRTNGCTAQAAREGIRKLPEPYRTVLILRFSQRMSYEEIARTIDAPLGTVKTWLARGLTLLRKKLSTVVSEETE